MNAAKPIQLRQETWDWLLAQHISLAVPETQLGSALWKLKIYNHPELLRDTVIELPQDSVDVEYRIPKSTAEVLANLEDGSQLVSVIRLYDNMKREVPACWVEAGIKDGPLFD